MNSALSLWNTLLLAAFLVAAPLSIRNVVNESDPGIFNEYTDVSLYLSDILLLLLVLTVLYNILINKSITNLAVMRLFHVEHVMILWFFSLYLAGSVFWATQEVMISLYTILKFWQFFFMYLMLILLFKNNQYLKTVFHVEQNDFTVPRGTFSKLILSLRAKCSTWNIAAFFYYCLLISMSGQAVVGILQFLRQKSLGLEILGESLLTTSIPGVAEIIILGDTYIRSYGLFPHPNIFGGYLAVSLLITLVIPVYLRNSMFHVEQKRIVLLIKLAIVVQALALFLSFSKSAIVGFIVGSTYLAFRSLSMFHVKHMEADTSYVPRGTRTLDQKKYSLIIRYIQGSAVILFITGIIQWINTYYFLAQPWQERWHLVQLLKNYSLEDIIFGVGMGQFVPLLSSGVWGSFELWQLQPIHNVPLLIISELGLIGCLLFIAFVLSLWGSLKKKNRMFHVEHSEFPLHEQAPKKVFRYLPQALLLVLAVPAMTDHYLWDIQQGQFLLWSILAFATASAIDE